MIFQNCSLYILSDQATVYRKIFALFHLSPFCPHQIYGWTNSKQFVKYFVDKKGCPPYKFYCHSKFKTGETVCKFRRAKNRAKK